VATYAGLNDQMLKKARSCFSQWHWTVEFIALQNKFLLRLNVFVVKKL